MAFEVSVFTDVASTDSVDGSSGFRFQALSADFPAQAAQWITSFGLHEVDTAWSADPSSQPPTCAYVVADGLRMLSRGSSTGQTLSGRAGNQLTETITTTDPDDFVPYRPAQLFGATNWRLSRAEGNTTPAWVTPLSVRPEFEPDELREWLLADEWAPEVLPAFVELFLAAVRNSSTLVIVGRDIDVVMRWISIGSLLAGPDVLDLEFRALVRFTGRERGRVIGVSPEFGEPNLAHVTWIDLERREISSEDAGDEASVLARWFVDHDPLDSLEAINLFHRWRAGMPLTDAVDAVAVVLLDGDGLDAARTWRAASAMVASTDDVLPTEDLEIHMDGLLDAVIDYKPTTVEEMAIAGAALRRAQQRRMGPASNVYALQLIHMLSSAPSLGAAWCEAVGQGLPPLMWEDSADGAAAGDLVMSALPALTDDDLPAVLSALGPFGLVADARGVHALIDRAVEVLVDDPTRAAGTPDNWWCGELIAEDLRAEVTAALRARDPRHTERLIAGHWDFLASPDGGHPVDSWLRAAALVDLDHSRRVEALSHGRFEPEAWTVAMHSATGAQLPELAHAWIARNELSPDLWDHLATSLDAALAESGGLGGARSLSTWTDLARELERRRDFSETWRQRLAALAERRESASLGGQFKRVFGKKQHHDKEND